jgi:hypothetical protein
VQVRVGTAHVQPPPDSAVTVRPGGGFSITVTGLPLDGKFPVFVTVTS